MRPLALARAVPLALLFQTSPALAQLPPVLAPGDTIRFIGADVSAETSDDCNVVNDCGVDFENIGEERPLMRAFSTVTVGVKIERFATGRLLSFFTIAGDNERRIGAKLSGRVSWRGWLIADFGAWNNQSTAAIAVAIYDVTTAAGPHDLTRHLVARQTLYTNAVSGRIAKTPTFQRAIGSGSFSLAVDLFRGHTYAAAIEVECRSSSGLVGISTAASFSNVEKPAFTALNDGFVQRDFMLLRTEPDYLALIDGLRDQFRSHRHEYLTGRGEGHNNTIARTSEAIGIPGEGPGALPVGAAAPMLHLETVAPDRVRLALALPADAEGRAILERMRDGERWIERAFVAPGGWEDRDVLPGTRYVYRARGMVAGVERISAPLPVDIPHAVGFSFEGARPNPAGDDLRVTFALPDAAPATIEVFDIAGRSILSREVGTLGAGIHRLAIAEPGTLSSGLYLLRLTRGAQSLTSRVSMMRGVR